MSIETQQRTFLKFLDIMVKFYKLWAVTLYFLPILSTSNGKILALIDSESWGAKFAEGFTDFKAFAKQDIQFDYQPILYTNSSQDAAVCQALSGGVALVLDFTAAANFDDGVVRKLLRDKNVPFLKVDFPVDALIKGFDSMLQSNDAMSNGYLIFQNDRDLDRAIHLILGNTLIRYAFLNYNGMSDFIREKFEHRIPSATVLLGNHNDFAGFITSMRQFMRDFTEWIFLYDVFASEHQPLNVTFPYIRGQYEPELCCTLRNPNEGSCSPTACSGVPSELFAKRFGFIVADALGQSPLMQTIVKVSCQDTNAVPDPGTEAQFAAALSAKAQNVFTIVDDKVMLSASVSFVQVNNTIVENVGTYSMTKSAFAMASAFSFRPHEKFFRIGIVDFLPWTYKEDGQWKGYCIDLADEIAKNMNFTYELVVSEGFGRRDNVTGRWDGLTGDLIHGRVDIAIAAYIMTSEREEFIDFVSPYYEQSGLIITMKKQEVKNSLFKFMTVLKTEVWLSIAGATISTGFMLWFLDKFSPYSAQNNPHKYKAFRKFTLKESFWFALTSFTPQGGGEPPKAFSGRTLVAAYWIFVVLMLATFTANLAAFLTVERMQSPIKNLEHLAAQSSVKYTVAKSSNAMNFFKNMAHAEETLYQMWRNLTLNAPSSAKEYIVWEYPIREMYIHINSVIEKNNPVQDYQEGFERAMSDDYFAFIHDAAQTRYHVYRNCNLTLIGEPFAEAPYAIAVQQGNPLQDNISMAILQLQTARFFEILSTRYWAPVCSSGSEGESDGISLESLGGVFIATIIGLGIAFISLAIEVFTTNRNRQKAKIEAKNMIQPSFVGPLDFYGATKTKKGDVFKGNFLPEVTH